MGKTKPKLAAKGSRSAKKPGAKPEKPRPTPKKAKRAAVAAKPMKAIPAKPAKQNPPRAALPTKPKNPAKPRRKELVANAERESSALLSELNYGARKHPAAIAILTRANEIAITELLRMRARNSWRNWASRELQDGKWEASLQFYEGGIAAFVDGDDDEVVADMLNEYAYALQQTHRLDDAEAACMRALAMHEQANRPTGVARVVYHLSGITFDRGNLPRATELARQAVEMSRAANENSNVALHLYAFARSLFEEGKSAEAAAAAEEGVRLAENLGWINLQGNLVNMVANIATEDGRLDEADAKYAVAIDLFERAKLKIHAAISLSNRANIAFDRGDNALAVEQHTKAIKALRKETDERSEAISLTSRAGVFIELARFVEAQQDFDAALEILVRIGQQRRVAFVRFGYARLSEARGDLPDALAHYAETEMSLESVGDNLQIARMLYAQLGLLAEVGDTAAALALLARADEIHSPAAAIEADARRVATEGTGPRQSHPGDEIALLLRKLAVARVDAARARAGASEAPALRERARALLGDATPIAATNSEVRRVARRLRAYLDAN